MKTIKPFLLFSILVLFFQCKKNVEIKGHWHIESKINNGYLTIDVINDTIAYTGLNSIEGRLRGKHNKKDGLLMFPGSCGEGFFQYYIKGQKIFLTNALETKTHGLKCDSCCNKIQDFSKDIDLDIDFPTIKNKVKFQITKKNFKYPSIKIQLGKPKSRIKTLLYDSIVIDLYTQYNYSDTFTFKLNPNIRNWSKDEFSRIPEQLRRVTPIIIIADKSVPISKINSIVKQLQSKEQKQVFIQTIKQNYKNESSIFEYLHIRKIDLSSNQTIGDYLEH